MDAVDLKVIPFERDYNGNTQNRPKEYGTYLVIRKDGKMPQKEVWNNTGWAYNHNIITHFYLPKLK